MRLNQMDEASMDGKYLYGFIQPPHAVQLDIAGIDEEMLYTIAHRDIAAVVSDTVPILWSDLPRETVFAYLTTHQAAIEGVMKRYEIIPAKFATVLPNGNLVRQVLKTEYHLIRSSLTEMANQVEMDVVVLWRDPASLFKKIAAMPQVEDVKRQMADADSDRCRHLQIQAGKQVKAILDNMNASCANEAIALLMPLCAACQPHEVKNDEMILNCAFLLERQRLDAFEKEIDVLDERYNDQLTCRIIGPLPPYSFRTLEIERIYPDVVENARALFSLGKTTTHREIRTRYRELAKTLHPDRFPEDKTAQNRFESFNKAYEILKAYCRGNACSFAPDDIQNWIAVRPMTYTAGMR
jgi:hypothetical protein